MDENYKNFVVTQTDRKRLGIQAALGGEIKHPLGTLDIGRVTLPPDLSLIDVPRSDGPLEIRRSPTWKGRG